VRREGIQRQDIACYERRKDHQECIVIDRPLGVVAQRGAALQQLFVCLYVDTKSRPRLFPNFTCTHQCLFKFKSIYIAKGYIRAWNEVTTKKNRRNKVMKYCYSRTWCAITPFRRTGWVCIADKNTHKRSDSFTLHRVRNEIRIPKWRERVINERDERDRGV
jgi:hypothetical protein